MNQSITRREALRLGIVGGGAAFLAACRGSGETATTAASASAAPTPITLVHEAGTTTLQTPATKLGIMQWQIAEALLALGIQPTALSDEQQPGSGNPFPEHLKGKITGYKSLGSRITPNLEVLASTQLDLIIADRNEHQKDYEAFSKIAPTVLQDTNSYKKLIPNFDQLAQATGTQSKGTPVKQALADDIAKVKAKAGGKAGPRVLVGIFTPDRIFAYFADSFQGELMQDLGATYTYRGNPAAPTEAIGLEALPAVNADVYIWLAYTGPTVLDTFKDSPLWTNLPPVKNKRSFVVSREVWGLGRGVIAVKQMAAQAVGFLYPA
ncbi:MAG TPA: iron-siderophore ABC transporter substrate-binding protein [Candidatus Limnocylindria bacterium]